MAPLSRRSKSLLVALVCLMGALGLGLGVVPSVLQARLTHYAAKHRLTLTMGRPSIGAFTIRFHDIHIRSQIRPDSHATVSVASVSLTRLLDPSLVRLEGVDVTLDTDREELSALLRDHRGASHTPQASGHARGRALDIVAERVRVDAPRMGVRVANASFEARGGSVALRLGSAAATHGPHTVVLADAQASFPIGGVPRSLSAESIELVVTRSDSNTASAATGGVESVTQWLESKLTAVRDSDWSTLRLEEGPLTLRWGTLTLRTSRREYSLRSATITAAVAEAGREVTYCQPTCGAPETTSLRLHLPAASTATISFRGPGLRLDSLGVDGDIGPLRAVGQLEVGGDFVLSVVNRAVDLEGTVGVSGLSFEHARISKERLTGLAGSLTGRLALREGSLSLDPIAVDFGGLRMSGHANATWDPGTIRPESRQFAVDLTLRAEPAPCAPFMSALPKELLTVLRGVSWSGTVGGSLSLSLDTRRPDAMRFVPRFDYNCRIATDSGPLSSSYFTRPFSHRVYSPKGEVRGELFGPGTSHWTPYERISRYLPVAVVMTEDGGTFRRSGFNEAELKRAIVTNVRDRRFSRGGSTLTMQLAKNAFLTRDKTLARKFEEALLTAHLRDWPKERIIELYLNIVEFAPSVYGVARASTHYFGKHPSALTLMESLFLASMLPAPTKFASLRGRVPDAWLTSMHRLAELAGAQGYVSEADVASAKREVLAFR